MKSDPCPKGQCDSNVMHPLHLPSGTKNLLPLLQGVLSAAECLSRRKLPYPRSCLLLGWPLSNQHRYVKEQPPCPIQDNSEGPSHLWSHYRPYCWGSSEITSQLNFSLPLPSRLSLHRCWSQGHSPINLPHTNLRLRVCFLEIQPVVHITVNFQMSEIFF